MRDYPLDSILLPMGAKEIKDEKRMDSLWRDPNYVAEEKYDGSRYLSVEGRFFSRRISDVDGFPVEKTDNVPHLSYILKQFPNLIIDGEVYLRGLSSNEVTSVMGSLPDRAWRLQGFGELQHRGNGASIWWRRDEISEWQELSRKERAELLDARTDQLKYVVFDILRDTEGNWLLDLTYMERRAILVETMYRIAFTANAPAELLNSLEISKIESKNKLDFYNEIMQRGGEGVILKHVNGNYVPEKKPVGNWVKVKKHITDDVVIMGFKEPVKEYDGKELDTWQYWQDGSGAFFQADGLEQAQAYAGEIQDMIRPVTKFYFNNWIGAVTFGKYGKDGSLVELGFCSGLTDEMRKDMSENPEKYVGDCMEIGAMEQTKDGFYRHPQFSRMRPDKSPSECVVE